MNAILWNLEFANLSFFEGGQRACRQLADLLPFIDMPELEHCDNLFLRHSGRRHSDADRGRRGFNGTKPDMVTAEERLRILAGEGT
jgi:hypothetical protein